jgi:dihydrofolate synthase/folylpolyglutamate synthase
MTAREYLFGLEIVGIKLGLEQIRALIRALDHPDLSYPSILVAGTNGKGSVTAMLERGLRDAGYRTGRYTSPHLTHIEERIALDGEPITAAGFDRLAERVRDAAAPLPHPPSFFEATTALALEAFREASVDVALLEVGLGGRLDATNAVKPVLSVITAVDLDHQQYLGDTIEEIAAEKAGIIKPKVPVVLGKNSEAVKRVITDMAHLHRAPLVYAPDGVDVRASILGGVTELSLATPAGRWPQLTLGLRGRHQVENAVTAARALEVIDQTTHLHVGPAARQSALVSVRWPGRLEMRSYKWGRRRVDVLIDGAHNVAGARALNAYLGEVYPSRVPIIFAAMADKDIAGIAEALAPSARFFVCTAVNSPRAATPEAVAAAVRKVAPSSTILIAATPETALGGAAPLGAPVVVAGSLYLAGEIRELLS